MGLLDWLFGNNCDGAPSSDPSSRNYVDPRGNGTRWANGAQCTPSRPCTTGNVTYGDEYRQQYHTGQVETGSLWVKRGNRQEQPAQQQPDRIPEPVGRGAKYSDPDLQRRWENAHRVDDQIGRAVERKTEELKTEAKKNFWKVR
jgi:hypothetical protein